MPCSRPRPQEIIFLAGLCVATQPAVTAAAAAAAVSFHTYRRLLLRLAAATPQDPHTAGWPWAQQQGMCSCMTAPQESLHGTQHTPTRGEQTEYFCCIHRGCRWVWQHTHTAAACSSRKLRDLCWWSGSVRKELHGPSNKCLPRGTIPTEDCSRVLWLTILSCCSVCVFVRVCICVCLLQGCVLPGIQPWHARCVAQQRAGWCSRQPGHTQRQQGVKV